MALLPFLGSGQTHKSSGIYQNHVAKGVYWLLKHQKPNGDLSADAYQPMYSHGIAAIALCECYGMTHDRQLKNAAQLAVNFIEMAQNKGNCGWRDMHGDDGDISVTGWQMMALKSAQIAGLQVDRDCLGKVQNWLKLCAKGRTGGQYSYLPNQEPTPTNTAIGALCSQYLGQAHDDSAMVESVNCLLDNIPDAQRSRNCYYWYYATMAMRNYLGPEWDTWNRQMRKVLILSQEKQGCASGSWDPEHPSADEWGAHGGRLMATSFGALTLEVYYRLMPLYRLDRAGEIYINTVTPPH